MPFLARNRARKRSVSAHVDPILNVVEPTEASPDAEISLYGDVCMSRPTDPWTGEEISGLYITCQDVLDAIDRVQGARNLTIHLNSSGGDVFAGLAIHNRLSELECRKTVVVDGLAASAASVIMCAGDTVKLHLGSIVMIHNVASFLFGYYSTSDLGEVIRDHMGCETAIKRIYCNRCGKPEDEIQRMLDETTWMVGQDAIDQGFADELIETAEDDPDEDAPEVEEDGEYLVVAGVRHAIANLGPIPSWVTGGGDREAPEPAGGPVAKAPHVPEAGGDARELEEEVEINSVEELRAAYPQYVDQLVAEATQAERTRIREIEEIQDGIRNPELVDKAKFSDAMTAGQLAVAALKDEATAGARILRNMDADASESNADDVDPDPAEEGEGTDGSDEPNMEEERAKVAATMKRFNETRKGIR